MDLGRLLISKIKNSTKIKILKKFIFESPYYLFDFLFITVSLIKNIFQYQKIYKKNLVIVTASDKFFANSLFQLLENLKLQDEIQEIIVYDLGMTPEQVNKLCNKFPDVIYERFKFNDYPDFLTWMEGNNDVIVYNTIQLYRWDRLDYLKKILKKYSASEFNFGFKLVRGAYMEKERLMAKKGKYKSPICSTKNDTDKNFDNAVELMFDNLKKIDFFVATHNENSNYKVMKLMKINGLQNSTNKIWFGQLYGMSDNITFNLAKSGYNVAKILPFGPVENLVPYLIRRAQENSSFEGQSSRELSLLRKELLRRKA